MKNLGKRITRYEVTVLGVLQDHTDCWLENHEIAERTQLNPFTTNRLLRKLFTAGVLDRVCVAPAYRYRLARGSSESGQEYLRGLQLAQEVFASKEGASNV